MVTRQEMRPTVTDSLKPPVGRAVGVDKYDMTPEQEQNEREIILAMLMMLRDLRDAGYSDFQTLTSFLANLCMDQRDAMKMLRSVSENVKLKLRVMRKMH
jgi:hypothetical protein